MATQVGYYLKHQFEEQESGRDCLLHQERTAALCRINGDVFSATALLFHMFA